MEDSVSLAVDHLCDGRQESEIKVEINSKCQVSGPTKFCVGGQNFVCRIVW